MKGLKLSRFRQARAFYALSTATELKSAYHDEEYRVAR